MLDGPKRERIKDQRKQNSIKDQDFCTGSFSTKNTACAVSASATVKPVLAKQATFGIWGVRFSV